MSLIDSIVRYVYGFSPVEFMAFIIFITWAYLKMREYISYKSQRLWNSINFVFLVLFVLFVVYRVILCRTPRSVVPKIEFIPFLSYFEYYKGNNPEAFITNRANILLFFPFGLLLFDYLKTKKTVIVYIIGTFIFSFALETVQYVLSLGITQIDDMIHNTFGAYLGYLMPTLFLNKTLQKRIFDKIELKDREHLG